MSAAQPLRVLVADDDDVLRDVLVEVLLDDGRFDVVAVAGSVEDALQAARREQPALALVDVKMPGGGGQRVASELRSVSPTTRVVALSSYDDRRVIVEMFRSGAVSYLVKGETTNADIISTLLRVADGELALPASVSGQLLEEMSSYFERAHAEDNTRRTVEGRIRTVLAGDGLAMVYQPVLDLVDGHRVGVEALARFSGAPAQGPDRWFADAAAVDLDVELELLAVRSAIGALDELDERSYLAVNVSPATAVDPGFQTLILGGRPASTVMEVTEHAPVEDYDTFQRAIEPLRAAGVRLAVDDAGAGFASLRHILLLAPDVIKLDVSLTRGIDVDRSRRAMARALISFADEVGATIVAEGIETRPELTALKELGVHAGQGYLLGRPGPLGEQVVQTD